MTELPKPNGLDVGPILVAIGTPRHRVKGIAEAAYEAAFQAVKVFGREDREGQVACVCGLIWAKCLPGASTEEAETIAHAVMNHYLTNMKSIAAGRQVFVTLVTGSANTARKKLRQEQPLRIVQ